MPPDFAELERFPPHVGRVVREAVTVAAQNARKAESEALADRVGRAVVRELFLALDKGRAPGEPGEGG